MTDADELIKAIEAAAFNPTYDDRMGKFVPLDKAITIFRLHTEGRPAVEGKPLELMTRDELLSYIQHSAKRDAMPAET
jgi:hypothetical protein